MTTDLAIPSLTQLIPEDAKLGPAMRKLSPRARAFVLALIELGGKEQGRAAAMAGYTGNHATLSVTASRLAADERVQEALFEEAKGMLKASALLAACTAVSVMENPVEKGQVRLQAARMALEFAGMQPAQKIEVTHKEEPNRAEQIKIIKDLAGKLGLDPKKLLGVAGVVVDAKFEVVGDSTGIEDLLA